MIKNFIKSKGGLAIIMVLAFVIIMYVKRNKVTFADVAFQFGADDDLIVQKAFRDFQWFDYKKVQPFIKDKSEPLVFDWMTFGYTLDQRKKYIELFNQNSAIYSEWQTVLMTVNFNTDGTIRYMDEDKKIRSFEFFRFIRDKIQDRERLSFLAYRYWVEEQGEDIRDFIMNKITNDEMIYMLSLFKSLPERRV